MEDEKRIGLTDNQTANDTAADYISAIKEIKDNSVSKEDYLKLKEENKQLLNSLVEGKIPENVDSQIKHKSIDELRKNLARDDMSNLEYIENALNLREELIKAGEPDPFTPTGHQISPTREDEEEAENTAQVLQECVDLAQGDSNIFTNELQRRLVDVIPNKRKR